MPIFYTDLRLTKPGYLLSEKMRGHFAHLLYRFTTDKAGLGHLHRNGINHTIAILVIVLEYIYRYFGWRQIEVDFPLLAGKSIRVEVGMATSH